MPSQSQPQSQPTKQNQYQVLARKYRPRNFHELVGQTHVSKALINAIDHNRLHHAYLFTGTRGVGKTTIARILSKCLNCDIGITSTPCGQCSSCVAIDEGRFIDLIEIDAASRTKVEDTRELLDNVPYAPTQGRYKVYLIDEVHMLSTHSFNALLKTLEEPPAHVKFLLATTDPQKLPITIISRCLQFVLRPLPQQAISEHLANILSQEQVAFTDAALWQLAHAAHGSVRDALSLTDQAIAFGQGSLTDDTVNDMLGLIDSADLVALLTAISVGDTQAVATQIEQMRAQLVDAGSMFDGLAELLHQVALAQILPDVSLNVSNSQAEAIHQLAQQISPDVLQLYYEITIKSRENIKLANTPLQALEMCLLRLLAFRPMADDEVPVETAVAKAPPAVMTATEEQVTEEQVAESMPAQQDTTQLKTHSDANILLHDSGNTNLETAPNIEAVPSHVTSGNDDSNDAVDVAAATMSVSQNQDIDEDKQSLSYDQAATHIENEAKTNIELHEPTASMQLSASVEANNAEANNAEASENASQILDNKDPRKLLECPKQILEGEWNVEKWDYWIQYARQNKILSEDMLALARQGVMTGQIAGESVLKVAFDTKHIQNSFKRMTEIMQQELGAVDIRLETDPQIVQKHQQDIPENRQKHRIIQAQAAAEDGLNKSAVMQYLQSLGQAQITRLKLNL